MIGVVFYQNSLVTELYSVVLFVRVSKLSFLNYVVCCASLETLVERCRSHYVSDFGKPNMIFNSWVNV